MCIGLQTFRALNKRSHTIFTLFLVEKIGALDSKLKELCQLRFPDGTYDFSMVQTTELYSGIILLFYIHAKTSVKSHIS